MAWGSNTVARVGNSKGSIYRYYLYIEPFITIFNYTEKTENSIINLLTLYSKKEEER